MRVGRPSGLGLQKRVEGQRDARGWRGPGSGWPLEKLVCALVKSSMSEALTPEAEDLRSSLVHSRSLPAWSRAPTLGRTS